MVKWIIPSMTDVVKEAIRNIRKLTEPAREVAKWYEEHPGEIYLAPHLGHLRRCEQITLGQVGEIVLTEAVKRGSVRNGADKTT